MTRPNVKRMQKNQNCAVVCSGLCRIQKSFPEGIWLLKVKRSRKTCCLTAARVKLDSEVPSRSRCNQPMWPSFETSSLSSTLGAQWDLGGCTPGSIEGRDCHQGFLKTTGTTWRVDLQTVQTDVYKLTSPVPWHRGLSEGSSGILLDL